MVRHVSGTTALEHAAAAIVSKPILMSMDLESVLYLLM